VNYILFVPLFFFVLVSTPAPQAAVTQNKAIGSGTGKSSPAAEPIRNMVSMREITETDKRILVLANAAAKECAGVLENAVNIGVLSKEDIISDLYFPILPITSPPTFSTFYDSYTDRVITPIVDAYLAKDKVFPSPDRQY
jgi:hypothetical protein